MKTEDAQELAQTLFEEIGDAAFVVEPESLRVLDVNPMAQRMTGLPRHDLLRLALTELFTSDEDAELVHLQRALHTTQTFHSQEGYRLKSGFAGHGIPVNLTLTRLHTTHRQLGLVLARDITERHEAEERLREAHAELEHRVVERAAELARANDDLRREVAEHRRTEQSLRDSEAWLRIALDAGQMGSWEWDPVANRSQWTEQVYRLLGLEPTAGAIDADLFFQRIHPEDMLDLKRKLQLALEGGAEFHHEFRVLHPDGSVHWLVGRGLVVRDERTGQFRHMFGVNYDITERKQAEKNLLLFRALIDQTHDSIEVIDPETAQVLDVNEEACRSHGYTRAEYLALRIPDLDPTVGPTWAQNMENLRTTGSMIVEGSHRRKDGTTFPVEVQASYTRLDRDYLVAVVRDISERKRHEEALRDEREFTRLVLDTDPNLIFVKDAAGRFVLANKAMAKLYGTTPDELVQREPTELATPREYAEYRRVEQEVLRTGRAIAVDESNTRPNGDVHWYHTIKVPIRAPDGTMHVLGIAADITERKRAEQAIQESRRVYQRLVNCLDLVVWEADPDTFHFTFVSPQAERLLGYPVSAWLEEPSFWVDHIHPEDRERALLYCQDQCRQRLDHEFEYRMTAADGHVVWVLDKVRFAVTPEGVVRLAGTIQDITAQKTAAETQSKLESQLRQSQKMEAVGQLAGGIAHDFNNLLTIIGGYSEVLLSRLPQGDPLLEFVGEIHAAGERATALTRQLLAFSRQQLLAPKVLNLNVTLGATEKMLGRLIGEDVILTTQLEPALWPVKADPAQMEQVLINLAVNARDAMPTGGYLHIATANVVLDHAACQFLAEATPGEYVQVTVRDSGVGMTRAVQSRIFEPFFTTKGPGKGTGLGLATVHGIITQSGGHIAVESAAGQGTAFKIYLPRAATLVTLQRADSGARQMPRGTETILFVEDEAAVRLLGCHVLRICGYEVLEAANGKAALELAARHPNFIALLISDVVMPYLGGRELAEQMAVLRPTCKVLFLSGYTDDAVVRHGVSSAEFAFLQKPFSPTALAQKVREVLDAVH